MRLFEEVWDYLQSNLDPEAQIGNWTVFNGYLGNEMTIAGVRDDYIDVDTPTAKNTQLVPKEDFNKVWKVWSDYKDQKIKRYEVRDMTRYSTYIISILHWFEEEN
jgi:hypothetical protein